MLINAYRCEANFFANFTYLLAEQNPGKEMCCYGKVTNMR